MPIIQILEDWVVAQRAVGVLVAVVMADHSCLVGQTRQTTSPPVVPPRAVSGTERVTITAVVAEAGTMAEDAAPAILVLAGDLATV